ncbi:MAG: divalent metal cation transporter [Brumimicrobium sp.]|nr:divalent metal cation transporter [Brumimicrobium sp.]
MTNWKNILGPGVLFAATAIGVSHLVQSTKAGALFGFTLIGFIALANILKYPFFEFGSRYAAATGKSIISGYYRLSKFWLYAYLAVTLVSMLFVTAAVGAVTIGFMENLFGLSALTGVANFTHYVLFSFCALLLVLGRFSVMEKLIKVLGIVLLLTTVFAFFAALFKGPVSDVTLFPPMDLPALGFLLPLMGWMPTAIDLSTWNSLWTVEKVKQTGYKSSVKEVIKEFGLGYWISAILAFLFLTMGALLVYGSNMVVPEDGVSFSAFVISLYTTSIGDWSTYIISTAAFSIMFSTFLTVIDGFSRALNASIFLLKNHEESESEAENNLINRLMPLLVSLGGLVLILIYQGDKNSFSMIVNAATTLSFVVAPLIALLNFRLVMPDMIGKENAPGKFMILLSVLGIIYLFGFLIWFLLTIW